MVKRFSSEIVAVITATEWDSEPTETTLRVALYGGMYMDTENPSGELQHYSGRIKSDVILDKKIGVVFWKEESSIDFGYLDVAIEDQKDYFIDFAKKVTIATVDIYRVNLNEPPEDQLSLVTSSRSSDIGFIDEFTIRFRLESILQGGLDARINELYYDDTYEQLDGKPYPIAWCFITDPQQLLSTLFVDPVTLLYHITDIEIDAFESDIYDRGVVLAETTNFIPTTNGFTLEQDPDGRITSGQVSLIDPEDSPSILQGLFRHVRLAMTRSGIWASADETELETLETLINKAEIFPQFFSTDVVNLKDYMDEILNGTGSWYYIDEFSVIHFGRMTNPDVATPSFTFTDAEVVSEIKVEDDQAPGLSTRISHAESPGAYSHDELAGSVSNTDRMRMTNTEYVNATTEPVIEFYDKATTREPIKLAMSYSAGVEVTGLWTADGLEPTADSDIATADGFYILSQTSTEIAKAEVDRWFADLYPSRRRFYTFDVVANDPLFDEDPLPALGDFIALQSDRFDLLAAAKTLLLRRIKFNFANNHVTLEGWG